MRTPSKSMTTSSLPGRRSAAARPVRWFAAAALSSPLLFAGCQSLDVVNQNSPAIEGVFSDAANIESALVGGFRDYWGVAMGANTNSTSPVLQLSVLGNELTTADAFPMEVTQEPRIAIDNQNQGGWHNRKPWYDTYQVIATGRDVLNSIELNKLKLGTTNAEFPNGQDTKRAQVFARFLIGVGNMYIGLVFDQGFPADETDNPATYDYTLQPYTALLEKGREQLRLAIAEAKAAPNFTLPITWINGQEYTRDQLVRIMYSFLVRSYAYEARTPAQRAATNWQQVLNLLDSGITTVNFQQQAQLDIAATASAYYQYSFLQTNGRTSNRLIGPADTTGAYQAWLTKPLDQRAAILIETPDKRIARVNSTTTSNPPAPAKFARLASQTMSTVRGTYMHSNYHATKYRLPGALNYHTTGLITSMSAEEMKFIRAEALFRLNRRAEVLPILNATRTAAGLAPVTVDGPPNTPSCVPRKNDGTCGDLFEALMYEKRIELFPTEALIAFVDQRGWGRLISGTPMHFPVHGRELETLGLPYYTIGGGGPGSAP